MRIATPISMNAASPLDVFDLVSPSRLFEMAASRFEAALATSTIGGPGTSPSAIVAVMASQQVRAGINTLQSIIVPSTPFEVRTRATRAIDHARRAVELLGQYHASVVGRGDGAHRNETLPPQTVRALEAGRLNLRSAISIARRS